MAEYIDREKLYTEVTEKYHDITAGKGEKMQYIPYAVTAAAIIGTIGNSYKKVWSFYIWIFTNAFWCVFNLKNHSYAQSILYAVYFFLAIIGIAQWRKKEK